MKGAALAVLVLAVRVAASAALPERPLPPDHPCLLPEKAFETFATDGGTEIRIARLEGGGAILRAEVTLPVSPNRLLALLADVDGWPRFIRRIRTLERLPADPSVVRVVFSPPWPLSDREYAIAVALSRTSGGGGTVFWESATERLPPGARNVVRVAPVRGGFAVSPGPAGGSSTLVYTERDSFAGTLPAAARAAARRRGPREIVDGLLELLASSSSRPDPEPTGAGRARVVDAAWLLAARAGPEPPLVLDARPRRAVEDGRVPGSRLADWRDFTAVRPGVASYFFGEPSRWGLLAEPGPSLLGRLRALGLSRGRPVVVVGSPDGWGEEGRIAWMLLALGVDDVALLDGGFPAWRRQEGAPFETGPLVPSPKGDFTPLPRPERRILLETLRSDVAEGRRPLLDARTPEEFAGKALRGQRRGGRLPGARLVPAAALRDASGQYVSAEVLARLVGPLDPARPPVTYCTGGVRSALLAILVEARLGVACANYDGSLWEWSARPELPLETGPAP